jgi:RNA-directed DNA polymerase
MVLGPPLRVEQATASESTAPLTTMRKSEPAVVPRMWGNARGGKGWRRENLVTDSTSADTERTHPKYLAWQRTIAEMARADPKLRFTTLAHRLTPEVLELAFKRLNRRAATGPDGVTVPEYGEDLEQRLLDLYGRMAGGGYRAHPARRVHIPKPNGKLRPLGIANVEDRVVQTAIAMALEPIYEQDFLDLSYGFRPGRSAHDALESLRRTIDRKPIRVVFEADIRGFFDHLDHRWLREFVGHRVADRGLLRLIGKVLKSGVVEEDGRILRTGKGAPQGGPLSPLLANVYLHYVLDLWFVRRFRSTCRGVAEMVRYADDFVVCFEHREDAERFRWEVEERFTAFGLDLVPDKTRLIEFGTDLDERGPGPESGQRTFDFLGFTHYLRRRPKRGLRTARKPSRKSRTRFLLEAKVWLWRHMHRSPRFHQKVLRLKLLGFYRYFGLRHCRPALEHVRWHLRRLWLQVLGRRSQKAKRGWAWALRRPWFSLPGPRSKKRPSRTSVVPPQRVPQAQLTLFPT